MVRATLDGARSPPCARPVRVEVARRARSSTAALTRLFSPPHVLPSFLPRARARALPSVRLAAGFLKCASLEKQTFFHIGEVVDNLELHAGDECDFALGLNSRTKERVATAIQRTAAAVRAHARCAVRSEGAAPGDARARRGERAMTRAHAPPARAPTTASGAARYRTRAQGAVRAAQGWRGRRGGRPAGQGTGWHARLHAGARGRRPRRCTRRRARIGDPGLGSVHGRVRSTEQRARGLSSTKAPRRSDPFDSLAKSTGPGQLRAFTFRALRVLRACTNSTISPRTRSPGHIYLNIYTLYTNSSW
jgi:hypothetical protein